MDTPIYDRPVYALGAVSEETGVKPATLRAWERRYGLPNPGRSEGGHRLYSQRDVDTVKWLLARQREGMRIHGAVALWQGLRAEGRDPMRSVSEAPQVRGQTMQALREEWVAACMAFDEARAEQALTEAFARYPPETVCVELLIAGIASIGQAWYEGRATVQQEHFASALAMRRVESLLLAAPPPTRTGRILTVCPPGEQHTFGLLTLTYLLRRHGWETLYLGANVPLARLSEVLRTVRPALIVSTAFQLPTAAALIEVARLGAQEGILLAYGGGILEQASVRERLPGHYLGAHMADVPRQVERLLSSAPSQPPLPTLPDAYRQALAHYNERLLQIEGELAAQRPDLAREGWFRMANRELARHISAALVLGEIGLLDESMAWLQGMGEGEAVPAAVLDDYIRAYAQAARVQLDDRCRPVLAWLDRG
ncbi:MAG: B12-binding domain-containing protein [Anaerolineae bacterium]